MELAIAPHLRCPRTRDRAIGDDYVPMFPGYVARPRPSIDRIVMAHFGVQAQAAGKKADAWAALRRIVGSFSAPDGPGHHELAFHADTAGQDTFLALAYWDAPDRFSRWVAQPAVDAWWQSEQRLNDGLGYFREIVSPRIERYESLLSDSDRGEGAGCVLGGISEAPIQEHGYWGSSRDRLPLSQTDEMVATGALAFGEGPNPKGRIRIAGHENMAFIRSGQDWAETDGKERDLYLREMEPPLRTGMEFLAREGRALGCYSSRYMRHLDDAGQPIDRTFGMAYWRSLSELKRWAWSHPTHKAIVGSFPPVAKQLNFDLKLRLYHEVAVLKAEEQSYEYINCHPATGLAGALALQHERVAPRGHPHAEYLGKASIPLPTAP